MKQNKIILLAGALLVLAGIWYFTANKKTEQKQETTNENESAAETVVQEVPNGLNGELKVSNDKRRGNLMLLLKDSDRIIYLNTSRDFSQLIGKQVIVTIEGSLDDFRLLDIKAQ